MNVKEDKTELRKINWKEKTETDWWLISINYFNVTCMIHIITRHSHPDSDFSHWNIKCKKIQKEVRLKFEISD